MQPSFDSIDHSQFVINRLGEEDTIKLFDCGDADLNDFIVNECTLYRREKLAVTYVLESQEDSSHEDILAFFSLSNDRISVSDFENKTRYNRFSKRFNNSKRLKSYPAVKIGRFAVSQSQKGKAIGTLLLDFIKSFFIEESKTGCRFITVDAYAAAVPFYLNNGFIPLNDDDKDDPTRLLYFDLNDIDM